MNENCLNPCTGEVEPGVCGDTLIVVLGGNGLGGNVVCGNVAGVVLSGKVVGVVLGGGADAYSCP